MKRIMASVLIFGLGLVGSAGYASAEQGAKPYDFTLQATSGDTVTLSSFQNKQPVLLLFWATWCPYCRQGLKTLASGRYEELSAAGIKLLAVNIGESKQKVSMFAQSNKYNFTILLDEGGTVAPQYDVVGIPTYVLINKKGAIVYKDNEFPGAYKDLLKE